MVAEVVAPEVPPTSHATAPSSSGYAGGSVHPCATAELVDLVARLSAEQFDQIHAVAPEHVHGEVRRRAGGVPRPVGDRQAREEPRRVDAHLAGEADEAAGPLAAGGGRDDVERRVGVTDQLGDEIDAHSASLRSRITTLRAATFVCAVHGGSS